MSRSRQLRTRQAWTRGAEAPVSPHLQTASGPLQPLGAPGTDSDDIFLLSPVISLTAPREPLPQSNANTPGNVWKTGLKYRLVLKHHLFEQVLRMHGNSTGLLRPMGQKNKTKKLIHTVRKLIMEDQRQFCHVWPQSVVWVPVLLSDLLTFSKKI